MKKIYLAKNANRILQDYLTAKGYELERISSEGIVDPAISHHPDIFLCKMGVKENAPVFCAEKGHLGREYPDDIPFNAACTGKYFIHNLHHTNPRLLQAAKDMGMELIHVRQGYTKCSICVVDEQSIITYDEGIVRACAQYPELSVLKISPGFIRLDGYDTGFIGGTSGRIADEVIFNGNLSAHPDFTRIRRFIEERGLTCTWFPEYPLTDIGSIL